jgi:hypothetical protein
MDDETKLYVEFCNKVEELGFEPKFGVCPECLSLSKWGSGECPHCKAPMITCWYSRAFNAPSKEIMEDVKKKCKTCDRRFDCLSKF